MEKKGDDGAGKGPVRGKVLISRVSKGPQVVSALAFCVIDRPILLFLAINQYP